MGMNWLTLLTKEEYLMMDIKLELQCREDIKLREFLEKKYVTKEEVKQATHRTLIDRRNSYVAGLGMDLLDELKIY